MSNRLENKRALVTGGIRGIGGASLSIDGGFTA